MADKEHISKLQKEDRATQFFKNFVKDESNEELLKCLKTVLEVDFERGVGGMVVSFLHVNSSNANLCQTFSEAEIDMDFVKKTSGAAVTAPIALFYMDGFDVLKEFLEEENPKVPRDESKRSALQDLLQFLATGQNIFADVRGKVEDDLQWAVRFAEHLMSPLVQQKSFTVDSCNPHLTECCREKFPMDAHIGDTSFGCHEGWHGKADILVTGDQLPFTVVKQEDTGDTGDSLSHSSDVGKVKPDEQFPSSVVQQIVAQAIVFSFLKQKETVKSLVPVIGISAKKLIVYIYDCIDDILLEGVPLDLYSKHGIGVFNIRTIVVLWLVLNYKLFGNRTVTEFKRYKSGFHHVLGEKFLEMYVNNVEQPCHVDPSEKAEHVPGCTDSFFFGSVSSYLSTYTPTDWIPLNQ